MSGIIGKKVGMTSIYDESGKNIPCTILQAGPCTITQIKTEDKDGYSSFQLGFDEKTKNTTKSYEGQFKKSKSKCTECLKVEKVYKRIEYNAYINQKKVDVGARP